jgi:hypothetical protein
MQQESPTLRYIGRFLIVLSLWLSNSISPATADDKNKADDTKWISLFDGKTLDGWQVLSKEDFEDGGKVHADKGKLVLEKGSRATGVRFKGKFPSTDYELSLEGMRVDGGDFFCGLSFPVGKQSLTLILGGWGGWVCGLSCIDDRYAINNDTACGIEFKNNRWYKVRLKVTDKAIQVSVDDKQIIDLDTDGYKLSVSEEMKPCLPLGIATWKTTAAIRKLRYRQLPKEPKRESDSR